MYRYLLPLLLHYTVALPIKTFTVYVFFHIGAISLGLSVASSDPLTDSRAPFLVIALKDPITEYEIMKEEPFCGFYLYCLLYYLF